MPTFSCSRRTQLGFTLVELLTVIGIIAVLAGMAFGVVSVVRKQAKLVQCTNNLQNLGTGMKAFQMDSGMNRFPGRILTLFEKGQPLESSPRALLVCPFDLSKGTSAAMGRPIASSWTDYSTWHEAGCSYMYETSDRLLNISDVSFFFPNGNEPTDPTFADGKANSVADAIRYQTNPGPGNPFDGIRNKPRPDSVPIIRDFHHFAWTGHINEENTKKVMNLSWALSVFWTIPTWENGYQP